MRDNFKSIEYYNKVYLSDTDDYEYEEESLKEIISKYGLNYEKLPFCYTCFADVCFYRFYLGYTMGKSYKELFPDISKYVENAINGWNGENFQTLIYICSFVILFNLRNENFDLVLKNAEKRLNDCKYGELFLKLVEPTFEVKADKTYYADDKAIVEVIELAVTDKEAAEKRLKKYVEKEWFKTLTEGLISNEDPTYRGYWCIEAAALVKALGLDDTELKECKYYPYDMAHFCD